MTHDNKVAITPEQRAQLRRAAAQELGMLVLRGDYQLVAFDNNAAPAVALPDDDASADNLVQAVLAVGRARKETLDPCAKPCSCPTTKPTRCSWRASL